MQSFTASELRDVHPGHSHWLTTCLRGFWRSALLRRPGKKIGDQIGVNVVEDGVHDSYIKVRGWRYQRQTIQVDDTIRVTSHDGPQPRSHGATVPRAWDAVDDARTLIEASSQNGPIRSVTLTVYSQNSSSFAA